MTSEKIKNTCSIESSTEGEVSKKADVLSHPKYICGSCSIITESLRKGCDVVQMPNGDIIIREQKVVTTKYGWNCAKEKMVKTSTEIESIPN